MHPTVNFCNVIKAKVKNNHVCVYVRDIYVYYNYIFQGRNKEQEAEVLGWIEAVLGEKLPSGNYEDVLRDGVILCHLINKLAPGSVKKIQSKGTNFQLMENIQRWAKENYFPLAHFIQQFLYNSVYIAIVSIDSKQRSKTTVSRKKKFSRLRISSKDVTSLKSPSACMP